MIYLTVLNNINYKLYTQDKKGQVKTRSILRKFLRTEWENTNIDLEELLEFYTNHPRVTLYNLDCNIHLITSIEDIEEHYPEYTL
jgi:hypothetical protein